MEAEMRVGVGGRVRERYLCGKGWEVEARITNDWNKSNTITLKEVIS
jgi:hypothetical protein